MSNVVRLKIKDIDVYFESDEENQDEELFATGASGAILDFDKSLVGVKATIEKTVGELKDLVNKPDDFELEFAIKMNSKVGAIFANVGAESTFKVKACWRAKNEFRS